MIFFSRRVSWLYFSLIFMACNNDDSRQQQPSPDSAAVKGTYAYDAEFLKKHSTGVLELSSDDGNSKILLSAGYQGRVMTSTATGDSGASFGWLNYDLIAANEKKKQFNPVGGEERFWIGPEGGQYSIYFKAGDSFNIAHWQVPALIDTVSYDVSQSTRSQAVFSKKATLVNYSGTSFNIAIERKISLLDKKQLETKLNTSIPPNVQFVGFETENSIQNAGTIDWSKDKGLLSIWLLGMFTPSPKTVVIIPFHGQAGAHSLITDNYFGEIPAGRLQVKDSVLYFTCDGKYRSKIGLSPLIAKPVAGSFDFERNVLTILLPQVDQNASYVNSKWEIQKEPYKGDVINSYNDGPLADGTQMGPFYEIESSSPALQLNKGQAGGYSQTTCHFQGEYSALKQLAQQLLGVNLDEIKR
ncbi:MAG: hypothetical protein JWM28_2858 [Chitinophagaceae bacterium]|nr:hypothetical protein [Chitinophagaceae bacterium]